jgi:hypothetical protein
MNLGDGNEQLSPKAKARRDAMRGELLDVVGQTARARKRRGRSVLGVAVVVVVGGGVWWMQQAPTAPTTAPQPIVTPGPAPERAAPGVEVVPAARFAMVAVTTDPGAADPYRIDQDERRASRLVVRTDSSITARLGPSDTRIARASDEEALSALAGTGVGLIEIDGREMLSRPLVPRSSGEG